MKQKKTPLELFRENEENRNEMAKILQNPVFMRLMAALRASMTPRSVPDRVEGLHPDTTISHSYFRLLGMNNALDLIEESDERPSAPMEPQEEAFFHSQPPEIQAAILKQRQNP